MPTPGFSYARLSLTKDSSEPNLDFQNQRNVAFLTELGFPVAPDAIYQEKLGHRSGRFIEQRKEMQRLFKDLEKFRGGAGAFFDFSRFSRSAQFAFKFIEAAEKLNIKLYNSSTREQITLDNASLFLRTSIEAVFSEWESRKGTERMRNAYARGREYHYVTARRPPMGLLLVGALRERKYIKDDKAFPTVLAFCKFIAEGKSIRAATLAIRKRGAFGLFQAHRIKRRFELYEPFIPATLYRQVARRFAEISQHQKRGRIPKRPGILAYGLLRCALCGARFHSHTQIASKTHPDRVRLRYQHSPSVDCPNYRVIRRDVLETQLWQVLDGFAERLADQTHLADYMVRFGQQTTTPAPSRRKQIEEQLTVLDTNFRNIIGSNAMTPAIAEQFNSKREELQGELAELKEETPAPTFTRDDLEHLARSASEWHRLADQLPEEFSVLLRDVFEKITVDRDNLLTFHPRPVFAALF